MVRNTFGGDIHDFLPRVDNTGAVKVNPDFPIPLYSQAVGGTVVTDFMLDGDGDGVFEVPASSIKTRGTSYPPDFQGPDNVSVLYYDPDPLDADVQRVRWVSREAGVSAAIPAASTTVAGIGRIATNTEIDTPTSTTTFVTPAGVSRAIGNVISGADPIPAYTEAIGQLQAVLPKKADLDVNGDVPIDQLPASAAPTGNSLALRRENGETAVGAAVNGDGAVPLSQAIALIQSGGSVTSDVRYTELATQPTSTTTTFAALADVAVTDAASGQKWQCDYSIQFQATAAAGIKVKHSTPSGATVTNKLGNPSADVDAANWTPGGASTSVARSTAVTGQAGTGVLAVMTTALTPANQIVWSEFVPCEPGSVWSAGGYIRYGAGGARNGRVDALFSDATGSHTIVGAATNGSVISPTTTTWQRSIAEAAVAPSWATQVCARLAVTGTSAVNDVNYFDAIQLEQAATLPAYGSTGGSGATALGFTGDWLGPNAAGTALALPTVIRYPAVANLTTSHGGAGATTDATLKGSFVCTVGGTGLTSQRIGLDWAQINADATNPTKIVSASAVFARLA